MHMMSKRDLIHEAKETIRISRFSLHHCCSKCTPGGLVDGDGMREFFAKRRKKRKTARVRTQGLLLETARERATLKKGVESR